MSRQEVSIDDVIAYLNELLSLDPKAMATMVGSRVPCNESLPDHSTALVLATGPTGTNARFGVLGLLNGLFGVRSDGLGGICAVFDKSDKLVTFARTPLKVDDPGNRDLRITELRVALTLPMQRRVSVPPSLCRQGGARSERNEPQFFDLAEDRQMMLPSFLVLSQRLDWSSMPIKRLGR
jgi:hypothetical protein